MKTYIQPGDTVEVTAAYDVDSGNGALVGSIFGMAVADALSGATVALKRTGVFTIAKTTSQAWTQGVALYWDNSTKKATTASASGANKAIGSAWVAADAADTTGTIVLTP
jgi:predicted RecA/RadA family phage recombinase